MLRKAFCVLIRGGLVCFINRDAEVKTFHSAEVEDLYEFRRYAEIGCLYAFESFERCANLAQELLALTIESGGAEACEDWEKAALLNTKFHQGIFEIPDNSHIAHLGKHINVPMRMIMLANGDSPEVYKPTVIRNAAIANAPLEGN